MPRTERITGKYDDSAAWARFQSVLQRRAERLLAKQGVDRLAYALEHHRTTPGLRRLEFQQRKYLEAIYRDAADQMAIKKCVQSGGTDYALVLALTEAEQGWAVLYVLQSQMVRSTFVPNRIDTLFVNVPHYRERKRDAVGSADSAALKNFGAGVIKFVGSNSVDEFKEFPADTLIIDEYDACDQQNLLLARDRLSASPHDRDLRLSTPTVEKFGIDGLYSESDGQQWHLRCEACGDRQPLDWFRNVVRQEAPGNFTLWDGSWSPDSGRDLQPVCRSCERLLDRLGPGEWVAERPGRPISGYHLSKLFTASPKLGELRIASLWEKFKRAQSDATAMQVFMNSDLGLAYTAPGARLTEGHLAACAEEGAHLQQSSADGTEMGVDVGAKFHVVITERAADGRHRIVYAEEVGTDGELSRLMDVFNVRCCVVDALPETHLMKGFQARHEGRIYLAKYDANRVTEPRIDEDAGIVAYDRTQSLDGSHAEILNQRLILPAEFRSIAAGEFVRQMCAPTRVYTESAGRGRYVWVEGSNPDHFRHAHNYNWMARDLTSRGFGGGGFGGYVIR